MVNAWARPGAATVRAEAVLSAVRSVFCTWVTPVPFAAAAMGAVTALVRLSVVPRSSLKVTRTLIRVPSSSVRSVQAGPVARSLSESSAATRIHE